MEKIKQSLIVLEGGSTFRVLEALKKHVSLARLPVIFLYNRSSDRDQTYMNKRLAAIRGFFQELGLSGRTVASDRFVPDPDVEYVVLGTGEVAFTSACQALRKLLGNPGARYQLRTFYEWGLGRVWWKSPRR